MIDPIKIGEQLKEAYLRYIEAGIPLVADYYEKERRELYSQPGVIMQPPYIELVHKYQGVKTLSEICKENGISNKVAEFINLGLLKTEDGKERLLYEHQEKALVEILKNKKNLVISTGTGSGKTEAFLIPLLTSIIEEAASWKSSGKAPAMRAMVLYPMNALAEDQMVRLRKSLDRKEVKDWLDENCNRNRITFGRYTSRTPKKANKSEDSRFETMLGNWNKVSSQINANPQDEKLAELLFSTPNCGDDSAEIVTRNKMVFNSEEKDPGHAPDILITNYSMLNIMLMRQYETPIFDETRDWLDADPSHVFTLIVDELHSYRGTQGTEVAYIIRVLLERLGLTNKPQQVSFLASSASMGDKAEQESFISDFFGTDAGRFFCIADPSHSPVNKTKLPPLPIEEFEKIYPIVQDKDSDKKITAYFAAHYGSVSDFVKKYQLLQYVEYALQTADSLVVCHDKYLTQQTPDRGVSI